MTIKILTGHVSQETAFLQEDYPYGRLRCKRRVWVETNLKKGQRFMAQTENPKNGRWNAPKASTYSPLVVMLLNEENDHVEVSSLSPYASEEDLDKFLEKYGEALTGEYEQGTIRYLRAAHRVSKKITWSVVTGEEAKNVPSMDEQAKTLGRMIQAELRKGPKDE